MKCRTRAVVAAAPSSNVRSHPILPARHTESLMSKPVRYVLAVVVALVAWAAVATLVNWVLRAAVAGYRAEELAVSFSFTSQLARLALGVIATAASAIVAVIVSRGSLSAGVVTGCVLLMLFIPVHINLWPKFPVWYHLFFLSSLPIVSYAVCRAWTHRNGSP